MNSWENYVCDRRQAKPQCTSFLQAESGQTNAFLLVSPNLPKNDKCKEKYQEKYKFLSHTAHSIHEKLEGQFLPFCIPENKHMKEQNGLEQLCNTNNIWSWLPLNTGCVVQGAGLEEKNGKKRKLDIAFHIDVNV